VHRHPQGAGAGASLDAVLEALRSALGAIEVGDPRQKETRMGRWSDSVSGAKVRERIEALSQEAEIVLGGSARFAVRGADAERGAFVAPTLLACRNPAAARAITKWKPSGPSRPSCPMVRSTRRSSSPAADPGVS